MERLYRTFAKNAIILLHIFFSMFLAVSPAIAAVPNDTDYGKQTWVYDQIGASTAWDYATGTRRVVVAVIDTGLDTWQDDIKPNVWTNPLEVADNNKDDDNNGYVDDVHGWNFVENNNDVRTSVFDNADDPEAVRHGTVVAGLIGAVGNNAYKGVGLNWQVSIMPLRAIRSDGTGSTEAVAAAIDYAVKNGADIISMSFVGADSSISLYKSLRAAYEKGVLIVTAAGNNDPKAPERDLSKKRSYPACYDKEDGLNQNWILTVGSVNSNDKVSLFSNYGDCVDIMAPGENIFSAERYAPQFGYANEFGGPWQGTSFATPLVAGTAALIKSIHPEWSPKEITSAIINAADSIDWNNADMLGAFGVGRLNAGKAIRFASLQPVTKLTGSLYYQKNKQLWRFALSTQTTEKVASFPEATIIAINPFHLDPSGIDGVALILKRGAYYYLHIIKADGTFLKEFAVKGPKNASILKPSASTVFASASGLNFVVQQANGTQVTYSLFDGSGVKKGEKTLSFIPVGWDIDPYTGMLYAAQLKGATAYIGQYSLTSKAEYVAKIDKVSNLYALKVAPKENNQSMAVALVAKGGALYFAQKAANAKNATVQPLATLKYNKKDLWNIKVVPLGATTYIFPYQTKAGTYTAFDSSGSLGPGIAVPALPATVQ